MLNGRLGNDFNKISEILLGYQAAGLCQLIKSSGLHGGDAMGDIIERKHKIVKCAICFRML
jgi:hypothetical protein